MYVLVLDHSLDAGHIHVAKTLIKNCREAPAATSDKWGHVQVVKPVLTRAARSNLLFNLDDGHTAL